MGSPPWAQAASLRTPARLGGSRGDGACWACLCVAALGSIAVGHGSGVLARAMCTALHGVLRVCCWPADDEAGAFWSNRSWFWEEEIKDSM